MSSLFSKILSIFGGSGASATSTPQVEIEPHSYKEYLIFPTPISEGGQYRLSARIEKKQGNEVLKHEFVRADLFSSHEDAVEFSVRKAKLIIDQNASALFTVERI